MGKKLELIIRDSKLKPDVGATVARELVLSEKCEFLIGPTSSGVALAVTKVLTTMLEIHVDLGDLAKMAIEAGERFKQVAAQAMEEYIDYFTEPIWERGDEEDDEEED